MPYQVKKDGKKWRVWNKDKRRFLPPHYDSKSTAKKVIRYLYFKESKNK